MLLLLEVCRGGLGLVVVLLLLEFSVCADGGESATDQTTVGRCKNTILGSRSSVGSGSGSGLSSSKGAGVVLAGGHLTR